MKKRSLAVYSCTLALFLAFAAVGFGQKLEIVKLPQPQTDGGKPLMQALKARKSSRVFSNKKLSPQTLSNLLWAAFGVNRPDGKRTAPTAKNWQEIDIYVALEEGVYLYDAQTNTLQPVMAKDIRAAAGRQKFTQDAPVNLIFVADFDRMRGADKNSREFYSATDTGFISQNVYLFCASEGLATVVLGYVNRPALAELLNLKSTRYIILSQPVGYPGK
ncbi:MAG: nitroreductase family protein [Victivallaceae bacterium]|nr:nitroreductase family protein [Victivallaceae bacterium]